ncbi:MAG: hypothetical protein IPG42_10735 [Betaproteobacteria bacterium]|nr:hypothetical protein [Betaproteobacteria bacterium]
MESGASQLARMRHQRKAVRQSEEGAEKGVHYFGHRKDPKVLAVYHDRPSKLNVPQAKGNHNPCLHIELRVTGSDTLNALGIASIEDLIRFDHAAFWNEALRFHRMPRRTELGRFLPPATKRREDVGDAALRKRAREWTDSNRDEHGNFILHTALLGEQELVRRFPLVSIDEWKKSLNSTRTKAPGEASD